MSSNGGTSNHTSDGNHSKTSVSRTRDDRVRTIKISNAVGLIIPNA